MGSSATQSFLVLNTKKILHRLVEWFPEAREELVVVSTPSALSDVGFRAMARQFRHLHVVESFDQASMDDDLAMLGERFGVRRVLSTGERDVLRAARLRERLGLPGQDTVSATAFRNKYVMKSIVAAAGIPVAPMHRISGADDLRDFAAGVGYPLVLKRLDAGGSNGTRVMWNEEELREYTRTWPPPGARAPQLAEAWVDGDFYQVNGLMDTGKIVLGQPSHNPYSDWFSVAYDAPGMNGMLADEHPLSRRLRESAAQVVAALPAVEGVCAFQTEFFHTPDDRLVLCEAACRAGGSLMVDTHEATLGVNLHGASLLGQAGRSDQVRFDITGERRGFARFPPGRGVLRALPAHCPLPRTLRYAATGEVGRAYDGAENLASYVAEIEFTLSDVDTASELREVEEWWDHNVLWEGLENPVPTRWKRTRTPRTAAF